MNRHDIIYGFVCAAALLFAACDTTIHEYPQPQPEETVVFVELNVDRTPPLYYKELVYDGNGEHTSTLLEPTQSATYIADERLSMRLITEIYQLSAPDSRTDEGILVDRREITVERLKEAPQDTVQFIVPKGTYRTLTWADYVLTSNAVDWHFNTQALNSIQVDVTQQPHDNHHKSAAAGARNFTVDFSQSGYTGTPVFIDETRAVTAENNVVSLNLQRASGRFVLLSTDLKEFVNSGNKIDDLQVHIIYKQYVSAGYNVDTGTPNHFIQTYTLETTPTILQSESTILLAYDYILTSSDREDNILIDIFIYDDGKEVNHYQNVTIPLQRNRETIVKGPFLTKEIGSGDIGIDNDFDDEIVVVIPD